MPSWNKENLGLIWEASRQGTAQDIISEMSNLGSNNRVRPCVRLGLGGWL